MQLDGRFLKLGLRVRAYLDVTSLVPVGVINASVPLKCALIVVVHVVLVKLISVIGPWLRDFTRKVLAQHTVHLVEVAARVLAQNRERDARDEQAATKSNGAKPNTYVLATSFDTPEVVKEKQEHCRCYTLLFFSMDDLGFIAERPMVINITTVI